MYLTKLNKKTGLVEIEGEDDGIFAIKKFRAVIDGFPEEENKDPDYGLKAFTVIALVADYLSKFRFYDENDRPRISMEEVFGDRDALVWKQDLIQEALKKYDELQYDPEVEEGKIYYESKISKMKEYRESEKYYGKKHNLKDIDGNERTFPNPATIRSQLKSINEDIDAYNKRIQGKDIYEKSPVRNGYKLSRLEQLIEKKNSFYNKIR